MNLHDYDDLAEKTPIPANAAPVVPCAGKRPSRAASTAISRLLHAIASCVAHFPRRAMQQAHRPPAGASLHKSGNTDSTGAGQWIRPRVPLVLPPSDGYRIDCDAGTIWITQDDTRDYVLHAGQSLALPPAGTVLVSAMSGPALVRHMRSQEVQRSMREKTFASHESPPALQSVSRADKKQA